MGCLRGPSKIELQRNLNEVKWVPASGMLLNRTVVFLVGLETSRTATEHTANVPGGIWL